MTTGWECRQLAELADLVSTGPFGSMLHKSDYASSGVPLINPINIVDERIVPDYDKQVSPDTVVRLASYVLRSGDVVVARRGDIGRCAVVGPDEEGWICGTGCFFIRPKATLDAVFLAHMLRSPHYRELLDRSSTGATMKNMSNAALAHLPISVPAPAEQQRIVAILDEAFEGIATAKANTEKNLHNARELIASRMQVLFGRDEAWEHVQLEELLARGWITSHLDGNHGSDYPRKEEFVDVGVPYIAASAIKGRAVNFDEAKYLSPQRAASIRKGLAKDRDVLFAHNATVGPVAILRTDEEVVILGTSLTYYRCDPQHIHPEYLAHFMVSPSFTSQYAQVMRQSTRNQVPITKQREFFHIIPPIEVQRLIAEDLDELSVQTERLVGVEMKKLVALDELKKSLLQQAFAGQLSNEQ